MNRKGFAPIIVAIIIAVVLIVGGAYVYLRRAPSFAVATLLLTPSTANNNDAKITINSGDSVKITWSDMAAGDNFMEFCPAIGVALYDVVNQQDFSCGGGAGKTIPSSGSYTLRITNNTGNPVNIGSIIDGPYPGGASVEVASGNITVNPKSQMYISQGSAASIPAGYFAIILNSRSTNTNGSSVYLYSNGSAVFVADGAATSTILPAGAILNASTIESLLSKIGDASIIPNEGCIKSASFGTETVVSYQGKTSGDLQCLSNSTNTLYASLSQNVAAVGESY